MFPSAFTIMLDDIAYEVSEDIGDAHLALIVCFTPNATNVTFAGGRDVYIISETQDGEAIGGLSQTRN